MINGKDVLVIKRKMNCKVDSVSFGYIIQRYQKYSSYYKRKGMAVILYDDVCRVISLDLSDIKMCISEQEASLFIPESFRDWTLWGRKDVGLRLSNSYDYFVDIPYESIGRYIIDESLTNTILFNLA